MVPRAHDFKSASVSMRDVEARRVSSGRDTCGHVSQINDLAASFRRSVIRVGGKIAKITLNQATSCT
jgi:hypothetical protein